MPSWVADHDLWLKAKQTAKKQDVDESSDSFYAIVSTIYKKMGGRIKRSKKHVEIYKAIIWFPIKKATQLSMFDRMNLPTRQVLVHEKSGKTHMQGYHVGNKEKEKTAPQLSREERTNIVHNGYKEKFKSFMKSKGLKATKTSALKYSKKPDEFIEYLGNPDEIESSFAYSESQKNEHNRGLLTYALRELADDLTSVESLEKEIARKRGAHYNTLDRINDKYDYGAMKFGFGYQDKRAIQGQAKELARLERLKEKKLKENQSPQDDYKANGVRSKAFKEWFGDWENDPEHASKVVDKDTRLPLVVFHGSDKEFNSFNLEKSGTVQYSDWGSGIYLTPRKLIANEYRIDAIKKSDPDYNNAFEEYEKANRSGKDTSKELKKFQLIGQEIDKDVNRGKVYSFYANIKNPFIQRYVSTPNPRLVDKAKKMGCDGIIVLTEDGYIDEVIAFHPNQIKSVDNSGEFNPADNNIYKALRGIR